MNLPWDIYFKINKNEYTSIREEESFEEVLVQIPENNKNTPKKELIRKIRNVEKVDLSIIEEFTRMVKKDEELKRLATSKWYEQILNFSNDYDNIKNIAIEQTVNYKFEPLIDLIIDQFYNDENVYGRMLNMTPRPMSSGEVAMINIFASIFSALKKKTSKNILLFIDEIDAFLHPKWQQNILIYITRWINESEWFNNKKVQLVIATHSPIILSDIPVDKITYLKEPFKSSPGEQPTFGANVNALFYNSFSLEQGSIGEIAKKEIQWAIDNIKNELSLADQRRLVYIIDNIGDKFLRERLKSYPAYIKAADGRGGL